MCRFLVGSIRLKRAHNGSRRALFLLPIPHDSSPDIGDHHGYPVEKLTLTIKHCKKVPSARSSIVMDAEALVSFAVYQGKSQTWSLIIHSWQKTGGKRQPVTTEGPMYRRSPMHPSLTCPRSPRHAWMALYYCVWRVVQISSCSSWLESDHKLLHGPVNEYPVSSNRWTGWYTTDVGNSKSEPRSMK